MFKKRNGNIVRKQSFTGYSQAGLQQQIEQEIDALIDLLGKPIAASSALCIPTAIYPFPLGTSAAYRFISGSTANPMCELGWKSLGVLELTALPSIKKSNGSGLVEG